MFSFKNIESYHGDLLAGKTTCIEAVNYFLSRVNDSPLNAFVKVFGEEALFRAKELDELRQRNQKIGKLHGVVISLKDVIAYKDHSLSASSKMLSGFQSVFSATVVERLLKEEAIIIGTCNCDEFAMGNTNENSFYGPVKNPHDLNKVAGGSSGGSAAAVAADLCMVSLGSDTGGSVRQPADFCGVIGFKPSYGSVSRHGLIAYASSFDQIGIIGKDPEDIHMVFDVIRGPDKYDSTAVHERTKASEPKDFRKMKIGFFGEALTHPSLDSEIRDQIRKVTEQLKNNGISAEEVKLSLLDYIVPAYYILTTAESSSNLSRYDGVRYGYRAAVAETDLQAFYKKNRSEGFGKEVKKRIMLGTYVLSEGYYDAYFARAQKVRNMLVKESEKIFNTFDIVLMPTVPHTAFDLGGMAKDPVAAYLADIFTVYANLTGITAASVPLFKHSNGMPFGLQALAGKENEVNLLHFIHYLFLGYKQYQ